MIVLQSSFLNVFFCYSVSSKWNIRVSSRIFPHTSPACFAKPKPPGLVTMQFPHTRFTFPFAFPSTDNTSLYFECGKNGNGRIGNGRACVLGSRCGKAITDAGHFHNAQKRSVVRITEDDSIKMDEFVQDNKSRRVRVPGKSRSDCTIVAPNKRRYDRVLT